MFPFIFSYPTKNEVYGVCMYRGYEALEAVVKKMCETCGSGISGMDDWIDNQEACMLMDVSPRKMLQLRRSRAIPYSYIARKVYYKRQDIICFMENNIHRITP